MGLSPDFGYNSSVLVIYHQVMAEAETRRTWDFASAAFHDGETAPPLTRRRRERGNASNARVPSSRREELREKGELFHLDKVKVQMTPTNNNTQKVKSWKSLSTRPNLY